MTNPIVTNLPATLILATSATLNGQVLSSGGQAPSVMIYYGPNDGGTNISRWSNNLVLGLKTSTFSAVASGLATNETYYFTASASNSAGVSWASPSLNFTTLAANPTAVRVPMLTYHNDNSRQGQNTNETLLTLANVNTNSFGKLFSYAVDGYVYSQPLIMTNVTIPGQGVHDVVFIATENDTVYAFDADSNAGTNGGLLWSTNLGVSALDSVSPFGRRYTGPNNPYTDITPQVGATGTPVIDPVTGTLYVNAFTREVSGLTTNYVHRIHALDVTTGNERPYSPVVVAGSVPGVGVDSLGGVMTFQPHAKHPASGAHARGRKLFRRLRRLWRHRSVPWLALWVQRHEPGPGRQLHLQHHAQCVNERLRFECRRKAASGRAAAAWWRTRTPTCILRLATARSAPTRMAVITRTPF